MVTDVIAETLSDYTTRLAKIEDSLNKNLPSFFSNEWQNAVFGENSHFSEIELQKLVKPCKDLILLGGKRWRPLLQVLCAELIAEQSGKTAEQTAKILETAYNLVPLVEFVHTASLIHDDIEDNADTRRGKPAIHITYGVDVAINSASWLYFTATAALDSLCLDDKLKLSLYKTFSTELRRLHLGQSMDINWHKQKSYIPTKDEYTTMVGLKTGTLAVLATKTGLECANATSEQIETLSNITRNIGIGFQILDDVINLTTGNKGKKRGDDVVEGKKSLPVILHLQKQKDDLPKIIECFEAANKQGIDSPAIETFINMLNSTSSIQEAKDISTKLINDSCSQIQKMFTNSKITPLITNLFNSMV